MTEAAKNLLRARVHRIARLVEKLYDIDNTEDLVLQELEQNASRHDDLIAIAVAQRITFP